MSKNVHSPKCVVVLGFAKSFFTILGRIFHADSNSKNHENLICKPKRMEMNESD